MTSIPTIKLKKDSYQKARGKPKIFLMHCGHCHCYVMAYQKDGPGPLKRCYLDRIHHPEIFEKVQHMKFDTKTAPKLRCSACRTILGFPMVYKKENRLAYRLKRGIFSIKKISK